jgi:uncharacterized protein (DUF4213/DUF364 family)
LNKAQKTEHCKNEQLIECKNQLKDYITKNYGNPKILQVGHQPRFTELLTAEFDTKVLDLDKDNIDKKVNNIKINNGELWQNFLDDIDLIFITGSSFVNDTAEQYIKLNKNIVFYGVTCAAPCYLLDLPRYCPEGN